MKETGEERRWYFSEEVYIFIDLLEEEKKKKRLSIQEELDNGLLEVYFKKKKTLLNRVREKG